MLVYSWPALLLALSLASGGAHARLEKRSHGHALAPVVGLAKRQNAINVLQPTTNNNNNNANTANTPQQTNTAGGGDTTAAATATPATTTADSSDNDDDSDDDNPVGSIAIGNALSSTQQTSQTAKTTQTTSSSTDKDNASSSATQTTNSKPTNSPSAVVAKSTIMDNGSASVVDVTSTVGQSASASAASKKDDDSSGFSKKTLIILIVVASSIGLIAAVWTLLRKWKFSPSRRFENRLNPIDWNTDGFDEKPAGGDAAAAGATAAAGAAGVQRNNSGSVKRTNSWGSAVGSVRGGPAMSERGDAYSHITGGYERAPPSNVGSGYAIPTAYPPGYGPPPMPNPVYAQSGAGMYPTQSNYTINAPYDPLTRQGTIAHHY